MRVKNARSFAVLCFLLLVTPHWVRTLSACSLHTNATMTTVLFQCSAKGKQTACSWQVKTHQPKQNYKCKHSLSVKMSFLLNKPYFNLQMRRAPWIISAPTPQLTLLLPPCFSPELQENGARIRDSQQIYTVTCGKQQIPLSTSDSKELGELPFYVSFNCLQFHSQILGTVYLLTPVINTLKLLFLLKSSLKKRSRLHDLPPCQDAELVQRIK